VSDFVVLRREDGMLTEPRPLSSVLTEASIRDQTVVSIVLPRPGQTKGSKYPICVVLDRAAYEASEAARAREEAEKEKGERKAKKGTKELEINWAIDKHDLGIKMKKLREFLAKGLRVEVLLLRRGKKRGRQATKEEVEETLRVVKEEAASVEGAREVRGGSGVIGERYQLFFEGSQQR
jgi:translation initiation factor IF-3